MIDLTWFSIPEVSEEKKGVAHLLAVLYDRQGRIDAAEREYLLALKETKNSPDVLNDYGFYLYSRNELTRAEKVLRDCLHQDRTHKTAMLNLGIAAGFHRNGDRRQSHSTKAVGVLFRDCHCCTSSVFRRFR